MNIYLKISHEHLKYFRIIYIMKKEGFMGGKFNESVSINYQRSTTNATRS